MSDMYDEGYGAGVMGVANWPAVVLGRFLRPWERKALAAGWRAGLRDLESYRADMATESVPSAAMAETLPW